MAILFIVLSIPMWSSVIQTDIISLFTIAENISFSLFYENLWDNSSPFMGNIYGLFHFFFGKNIYPLQIAGTGIILYNTYILNQYLVKEDISHRQFHIAPLLYLFFCIISQQDYILTAQLFSQTFIILFFKTFYPTLHTKTNPYTLTLSGIYIGIAILFYFDWIILLFLLSAIYSYSHKFSVSYVILGAVFTLLMVCLFYLFGGLLPFFWKQYILFNIQEWSISLSRLSLESILFFLLTTCVFLFLFTSSRYTLDQRRMMKISFIWYVSVVVMYLLERKELFHIFLLFTIPQSILFSYIFFFFKKQYVINFLFLFILFFSGYIFYKNYSVERSQMNYEVFFRQKKILLIGEEEEKKFLKQKLLPPFINPKITTSFFEELTPQNLILLYEYILLNPPKVVIDKKDIFSTFLDTTPFLKKRYRKTSDGIEKKYVLERPISLPSIKIK